MELEFDAEKSVRNATTRGIGFERFADMELESAIALEDTRKDYGESRLRMLGLIDGKLHAAMITLRNQHIRVISLRRANKREERRYGQQRPTP